MPGIRGQAAMSSGSTDPLLLGKQSGRTKQQYEDDEEEAHRVPIARRNVADAKLFGEAKNNPAERRAEEVTQAAEDQDGEALRGGGSPLGGGDDKNRPERPPRRGRKAGAEREGRGVDALDPHAHQRRRFAVL